MMKKLSALNSKKSSMKIALLHNLYGELSRGGGENFVQAQAAQLRSQGQEVFIITTTNKKPQPNSPTTASDGTKIYQVYSHFYNLGRHSLLYRAIWQFGNLFSLTKFQQIKTILTAERPDLVITHNLMGLGYLTPIAIRQQKIRHEHFLHDIQLLHPSGLLLLGQENKLNSLAARLYQAITKKLLGSPSLVSSPSNWLLQLHLQRDFFDQSKTQVCPWSETNNPAKATTTTINPNNQPNPERQAQDQTINLLFVGQIEIHKGLLFLIKTLSALPDSNFNLNIIGEGSQLARARQLAHSHKNIHFLGRRDNSEVLNLMSKSDYLVMPSLCYENSPRVIFEAQQLNLPVLAARIGGIPEMLTERDIAFRTGDENDLLAKLTDLQKLAS
jgi:glycosyltransferase involved in cell wall biosynthesis